MDDSLDDFERTELEFEGKRRTVLRKGEGPAVIVMAEMPGITPLVADFSRRVVDLGCSVWMPVLFGTPGKEPSVGYGLGSMVPACVSREFRAFATDATTPVSRWMRGLSRHAFEECGGPGVGAVGMCFTGGFALGMMVDEHLIAPVLSQPSLPLGFSKRARAGLGISPEDLDTVKERTADGVCVLGLRFTNDPFVKAERFERLRQELGDGFVAVEIDSSPGNPWGLPRTAHSVLTEHLVDEPGHPTREALGQVLDLFRTRLVEPASAG